MKILRCRASPTCNVLARSCIFLKLVAHSTFLKLAVAYIKQQKCQSPRITLARIFNVLRVIRKKISIGCTKVTLSIIMPFVKSLTDNRKLVDLRNVVLIGMRRPGQQERERCAFKEYIHCRYPGRFSSNWKVEV